MRAIRLTFEPRNGVPMALTKVYASNSFQGDQTLTGPGTVTVQHDAVIAGGAVYGLDLSSGPWTLTIDGIVSSDFAGINIFGSAMAAPVKNSTIKVGAEAAVYGDQATSVGIGVRQATDITNAGVIRGKDIGIYEDIVAPSTTKAVTISNAAGGLIDGTVAAIYHSDAAHALKVTNKGELRGAIGIEWYGALTLTNTGTIQGTLKLLDTSTTLDSSISNTASIYSILLGDGDDVLKNSGTISSFDMGGGNNTVTNTGHIDGVSGFGIGNDTLTNSGKGSSLGIVFMTEGNSTVTNAGTITKITFGTGNDSLTNTGTIQDDIAFFSGSDKLTNSGTIDGNITANGLVAGNTGTIDGFVTLGSGAANNGLTNGGTILGGVTGGSKADIVSNTKLIDGFVHLGAGDNKLTNSGSITGDVTLGTGNDTVTNSGTIESTIDFSSGADKFTNSGLVVGDVTFGTGGDVFTNSGRIVGKVSFGDGADVVSNTGVIFATTVALGAGDDSYTGGNNSDSVRDEAGKDTYRLGGGDDSITVGNDSDFDVFDGGAGNDTLFSSLGAAVFNLGTKAVSFAGHDYAANAITRVSDSAVVGSVKYFEVVVGGTGNDAMFGTTVAETLIGSDGDDVIVGGGGGDQLDGGSGVNTYVYLALTDSGNTKATRDTILHFSNAGPTAGDKIDVHAIDANSKAPLDQDFSFIGPNGVFTAAGQIRTYFDGTNTLVQGDVNGDGKADFTIAVVGAQNLTADDFVL